jgi:hypothetical protein
LVLILVVHCPLSGVVETENKEANRHWLAIGRARARAPVKAACICGMYLQKDNSK